MQQQLLTFDPTQFRAAHDQATLDNDNVGFKAAVNILESWKITDAEKAIVLGDISSATFRRIKGGSLVRKLTIDRRTRVSLILGIHKALRTMFIQDKHRLEWVNNKNSAFNEHSPKELMLSGALIGLHEIRHYLDSTLV
ncbi:MAG: DUF2384 domain-containing protein [Gammaproteobacteria bacterium]|nr:DUF2384 domain-containing protein [Gammaproteobacteria bacterium]